MNEVGAGHGFPDVAGIEYVGLADVVINTLPSAGLAMAVSSTSTTAGVTQSVTVSATDLNGNPDHNYTGTVHFASTDPMAALPADYTFTDAAQRTFSVTFKTAGTQSITVTDTANANISGSATSTVIGGATASLVKADTTTEGNWIGTCDGQGYDIEGARPACPPTPPSASPARRPGPGSPPRRTPAASRSRSRRTSASLKMSAARP